MAEQIPADRFSSYVKELVEFSAMHRVACGRPEDLARLPEALRGSESFAADFGSSMRSIIFRELCKVSESELTRLVIFAWGGESSDVSVDEVSFLTREIRTILRGVSRGGLSASNSPQIAKAEKAPLPPISFAATAREVIPVEAKVQRPTSLAATTREVEPVGSKVQPHRPPERINERHPPREVQSTMGRLLPSLERENAVQQLTPTLVCLEDKSPAVRRRFHVSAAEVLALGLTGLAVALLSSIGSLPVYRSRVSLYLPPTGSAATSALRDGSLITNKVAGRLLGLPHQNTILRQDAFSRGMRDLHLGDSEPILYADLVADTARQVTVKRLPTNDLYEITCDSWSPRLAGIFCNEFTQALDEQMGGALASPRDAESAHVVDSASVPGIQVYPRWLLRSLAGLIVGCLAGVGVGLVERPPAVQDA